MKDVPGASAEDLETKARCSGSAFYGQSHEVPLRSAVVDTATRPFRYYCAPCAEEHGYVGKPAR